MTRRQTLTDSNTSEAQWFVIDDSKRSNILLLILKLACECCDSHKDILTVVPPPASTVMIVSDFC